MKYELEQLNNQKLYLQELIFAHCCASQIKIYRIPKFWAICVC